jgi:hypothetical protein
MHAEGAHAFQQAHSAGYGNVEVWLLQPVAKTRIEQLNLHSSGFLHLTLIRL